MSTLTTFSRFRIGLVAGALAALGVMLLPLPADMSEAGRRTAAVTALMAVSHQPGLFQNPEMFRDGRLRDPGLSRQGPDRLFSFAAQPLEDGAPARIGESSEKNVVGVGHSRSITHRLLIERITGELLMSQACFT